MGQFVGERKHLSSLAVGGVNEDQRGSVVDKSETSKFGRVQFAVAVAADDRTGHHKYSGVFSPGDELTQGIGPRRQPAPFCDGKPQNLPHRVGHLLRLVIFGCTGDKFEACKTMYAGILAIPVLPLLAEVQGIQQRGARFGQGFIAPGPEIGYRELECWRFRQKKIPDRGAGKPGEIFQLFQRWQGISREP